MDKVKIFPPYEEASKIVIEKGIKSYDEYKVQYKDLGLPCNPNNTYKEKWVDWPSFLGKEKIVFPPYEKARRIVFEAGIKTNTEYLTNYKKLGLPSDPYNFYKKEWIDWPTFLGKETITYPPYEEASKIAIEKGIKSQSEYKANYKELGLPSNPDRTYKEEWIDWNTFLGKDKKSYEEASKIAIENGIKSQAEYRTRYKELGLPSSPYDYYKEEWIGWNTFLGKEKKSFPSSYEEASKIAIEKGIKSYDEYKVQYKELGLPSNPYNHYKEEWIDWNTFLGKDKRSYEEASKIAIENGIKSQAEYKVQYKDLGLPSHPDKFYKEEWIDWNTFLGKDKKSYEEASKIAIENGIKSQAEYKAQYKELGLPSAPNVTYKGKGWIGWNTFLGKEKKSFPSSYEEASKIAIEKGIKSYDEYWTRYKDLGLPSCPHNYYKGKGWIDWADFLGRPHKTTPNERKTKVLSKLVLNPILLGDKAPLQIIYMLATNMDKELAEEIELLLKTASFEERLDWVKEQLKTLKVAVPTTPKSKSKTLDSEIPVMESMLEEFEDSMDEISAMESMLDVFEDTFDDLSEEDSTNIQTILENYYHNVINKELIAEYDE